MNTSFRLFVANQEFPHFIKEEESSPAGGNAPVPNNPDKSGKTNKYHFDMLQQQFGIDDSELTAALEGGVVQVWKVPDYSSKWGFLVAGPCSAILKKRDDGNYDITYQLASKKLMNPKSFIIPYDKGDRPFRYNGKVSDMTEIITSEELQDIMSLPLAGSGAHPAMGGMPGMPGMPGIGGM